MPEQPGRGVGGVVSGTPLLPAWQRQRPQSRPGPKSWGEMVRESVSTVFAGPVSICQSETDGHSDRTQIAQQSAARFPVVQSQAGGTAAVFPAQRLMLSALLPATYCWLVWCAKSRCDFTSVCHAIFRQQASQLFRVPAKRGLRRAQVGKVLQMIALVHKLAKFSR